MLVHPNSGCEMEDHDKWSMWGGHPWKLDLTRLSHDEPFPWKGDTIQNGILKRNKNPEYSKFID